MGLAVQAEVFTVYGLSLDRQAWVVSDKTYLQLAYVKPGVPTALGPCSLVSLLHLWSLLGFTVFPFLEVG